jgi:hypothetical protein
MFMTNDIFLSPHFKLLEFEASHKAEQYGINNTPPEEAVENLRRLCEGCLEPLREALGLPVVITSGFRTKELNALLAHSSSTSQHTCGKAADFYVGKGSRELQIKAFREILTNPKIDFDQLILYPNFIHVSYVSKERNRHGILKAQGNGKLGYGRLTRADALSIS